LNGHGTAVVRSARDTGRKTVEKKPDSRKIGGE